MSTGRPWEERQGWKERERMAGAFPATSTCNCLVPIRQQVDYSLVGQSSCKKSSSFSSLIGESTILRILDGPLRNSLRNLSKFCGSSEVNVSVSCPWELVMKRYFMFKLEVQPMSTQWTRSSSSDGKDQWKFMRFRNECDNSRNKKDLRRKAEKGHGESHRPRVRIGESQIPVREEIGESQ